MRLLKPPKRNYVRKEVTCDICRTPFIGKYSLNRHMKNVHGFMMNTNDNETQSACSYRITDPVLVQPPIKLKKVWCQKYKSTS